MALRIIIGIFIVLHGLVHLLYLGHGLRFFELADLKWPDSSWLFSALLGQVATRRLAAIACALATLGFAAGGVGILAGQGWWRPLIVGSAAFSTAIWLLFWNGAWQKLADQGLIAVLINGAILVAVLAFNWPDFGF